METTGKTARQIYEELKAGPRPDYFPRYGFGTSPALVAVDLQKAYTDTGRYATAYEGHPGQFELVNGIAARVRAAGGPVIWTTIAYLPGGIGSGLWGTRTDTPDSIQHMTPESDRAQIDPRLDVADSDVVLVKTMASAFHDTILGSLLTFHKIDTVIVAGGATSGCVRATVVDSNARGYRTIVPEECVSDRHESPHYANLYDMTLKYADVLDAGEVLAWLDRLPKLMSSSSPGP